MALFPRSEILLQLKDIKKKYKIGEIETIALDGISANFREKEFVAILGTSGSGKTTALNIIGGLDKYDSGDLIIKGKSTKNFKNEEWDAYRNNSIGFVFQNYNLISHLSIVANVELGMTLSGVSREEKNKKALEVLEEVGLKDHVHKKPNQLSGGQMQRVAIARALANDPEILLCDEPTGALDSNTSTQILDLIKKITKDRLVIMVTHDAELAEKYANRIIRFSDGKIVDDSNPYERTATEESFSLKKTSMNLLTALKLSFNNLITKKGRTFLTAFASSIGIIGIAVILSLSTGFQEEINEFETNTMAEFPIMITQSTADVNEEELERRRLDSMSNEVAEDEFLDTDKVFVIDPDSAIVEHRNNFSDKFMEYIEDISPEISSSIGYTRLVNINLLRKSDDSYTPVVLNQMNMGSMESMTSTSDMGISSYPTSLEGNYLKEYYDILEGEFPQDETDVILVINTKNQIRKSTLESLGFDLDEVESILFEDIVGTEYRVIHNDDYYEETEYGTFIPSTDYESMINSDNGFDIRISGILRQKVDTTMAILSTGIAFSDELAQVIIDQGMNSEIVEAQREVDYNIMSMEEIDEDAKENFISYLGGDASPFMVMIFPKDFNTKENVIQYIDDYNVGQEDTDVILYTDLAGTISDLTSNIMNGITAVLIAFASISLVVSMIMIGIITYTSVLERTKEIGILKALGARKKDITRVFDAETIILGVLSGVLGVVIAYLLTFPINNIIHDISGLENAAKLRLEHAVLLVIISTIITVIGGHIPAKMASKKDAVEALRTE